MSSSNSPAVAAGTPRVTPALTKKILGTGRILNPNSAALLLTTSALAVVLNVVGGTAVALLGLPFLFLDAIGTFFIAAAFGIRWGILVGVITNLVLGVTSGPTAIPFLLVQVVIAIIVGTIANTVGYTWAGAALAGLLVAIIAPIVGTAIAVLVFGGITGSGLDVVTLWLVNAGQDIFGAAFWPRFGANVIDKVLTAFVVYAALKAIPSNLLKPRHREHIAVTDGSASPAEG
ncbi:MAG: CD3073 family putative ECF transporter S component [Leucobacter sp.]